MRSILPLSILALALLLVAGCDRGDSPTLAESIEAGAEALAESVTEEPEEEETAPAETQPAEESEDPAAEAAGHEGHEHGGPAAAEGAPAGMGHDHETIEVDESEIVAQPGASMGDAARCPVSGETFRVRETSPSAEHEGGTYYFCCGSCVRPFLRNPDQYLTAAE